MRKSDFNLFEQNKNQKIRFHGDYFYRGIRLSFTLNEQKNGRYRGRITVISPLTAKPMVFLSKNPFAKVFPKQKKVKFKEISIKTPVRAAIKAYIQQTAQKIHADNALTFNKLVQNTVHPDTMYPELAGHLYGPEFIRFLFEKNKDETQKKKLRRLEEILADCPFKPMLEIKQSEIQAAMKKRPKSDYDLLFNFWNYCILHHYCAGNNPVDLPVAAGPSDEAKQEKVQKLTRVPAQNLKNLNAIAFEMHDGPSCGVLLMESGISAKASCALRWCDITWPSDEPSYALVKLDRPDVMCAIHNYTRPLLPVTAMVLHTRREELSKQYSQDDLPTMWVVSTKSDPTKPMLPSALVQESKRLLIQSGIHENKLIQAKKSRSDPVSARILGETYKDILIRTCGIEEGSGTYKFLLGHAIYNDVSSSNYLSFTSPPAYQNLYKYLLPSAPKTECQQPLSKEAVDGSDVLRVLPDSSDRCAGLIFDTVLQPGEEMILEAETGVTGRVIALSLPEIADSDSQRNEADQTSYACDDAGLPPSTQAENAIPAKE